MQEKQKKKKNPLNNYVKYSSLTLQMGGVIFAGAFFGDFVDKALQNNNSIATIFFSIFSIGLSMFILLKNTKR
tara:strand:- start:461 stop:679 length:219 start_codon:yes stop_codon:yes gene_type:complete